MTLLTKCHAPLLACEGACWLSTRILGVEAQTLSNVYLALDQDLEIIPVLNKIDLPSADVDRVVEEHEEVIGIEASGESCSAKTGLGFESSRVLGSTFLHPLEKMKMTSFAHRRFLV